jgi:hypothetical protein
MADDDSGDGQGYLTPERIMMRDVARQFVPARCCRRPTGSIRSRATCRAS